MQIKVDCPTCGHSYRIDQAIAGLKLQCSKCGATLIAPEPAESRPAPDPFAIPPTPDGPATLTDPDDLALAPVNPQTLPVPAAGQSARSQAFDVFHLGAANKHRRLARRLAIVVAILVYISSLAAGVLAFTLGSLGADQLLTPAMLSNTAIALGILAFLGLAAATAYLLSGLRIRSPGGSSDDEKESFLPVVIILVLSSVHLLLDLAFLVIVVSQAPVLAGASVLIAPIVLGIALLYLFILAPLLYFSIRILQVRR